MCQIKDYYKHSNATSKFQGKMSIERLRTKGGWPKLKAKAAATRHLAQFACSLAHEHLDERRQGICTLLCRFYEILGSEQQFLSPSAKEELPILGQHLCQLYCVLANEALDRREKLWKFSPKVHLFQHLTEWQAVTWGNPKYYWVYCDEDLVGQMIEVAQTCHPTTVAATAMFKWVLLAFD